MSAAIKFAGSLVNPWQTNVSLKTDFSMKYGTVTNLTQKAGKLHNSVLRTVSKVAAFPFEALATFFYNVTAFVMNNTFGRIYNGIIHIQNKRLLAQNNNWKIKNYRPFFLAGTIALSVLGYLGYKDIIPTGNILEKARSLFTKTEVRLPEETTSPSLFSKAHTVISNISSPIIASIDSHYRNMVCRFGAWMAK